MKHSAFEAPRVPTAAEPAQNGVPDGAAPVAVAYLVHDLADAAVCRRIDLLHSAGARIALAGFHRSEPAPVEVGGVTAQSLGRTRDGALLARAGSVLRQWLAPRRLREATAQADVLMARNLEALVLAARIRRSGQRLVYECLDIHRLLLGEGLPSRLIRAVEAWAMRDVDLVVVSAPAFRDRYFRELRGWKGEIALVENLAPVPVPITAPATPAPPHPPWRIGWFGMLRCRRSLTMLRGLAESSRGKVEVLLAGRPSPDIFPDFAAEIAGVPGLRFAGSYAPEDLAGLYRQVHFAWSIDYFEDGLNSAWLLPNRLYEGLAHGAVPIALPQVATGEWLARHGAGLLTKQPERELPDLFRTLSPESFNRIRAAASRVPRDAIVMDARSARHIGRTVLGLS
ncbi:succinoglycan biosynthesis protein ExoL [Novosphingobium sp. PhB165]|uniref:glycosyltransferase family 4 protein n=1 Tax=Novosphingobium sp. PhB165 TaxID=2485105 RepID=UPI0010D08AAC|nr:glycosyltransferase family 4 protein [Novosphingobium sp. PhB165]TCM18002.1 succinoglycan biosynthesis protein ExoL [Novosphingobium sp. PhB165]